jgi:hypothetical protein
MRRDDAAPTHKLQDCGLSEKFKFERSQQLSMQPAAWITPVIKGVYADKICIASVKRKIFRHHMPRSKSFGPRRS